MEIRLANLNDVDDILNLLLQVHKVHSDVRPDIFKPGQRKYEKDELISIINNPNSPVYVYLDDNNKLIGYIFTIYKEIKDNHSLQNLKTLYIDDLCVDKNYRKQKVATKLFEYVVKVATNNNCYNITLNVYNFNQEAMKLYEKVGMKALKTTMEKIL